MLQKDFSNVSKTAYLHIYYRTFYNTPYADKMMELTDTTGRMIEIYSQDFLNELDIVPIMEARYEWWENVLEELIKSNPSAQIIELAAGFALHGLNIALKYPEITYFETDLSDIIKLKQDLVENWITKEKVSNLRFEFANALDSTSLQKLNEHLDYKRPLIVYCEWMMNYFNDEEKQTLADNIKSLLKNHEIWYWITPDPAFNDERRSWFAELSEKLKSRTKVLENVAKQKYSDNWFRSEQDADKYFSENKFNIQKVNQPIELDSLSSCEFEEGFVPKVKDDIKKHWRVWILNI